MARNIWSDRRQNDRRSDTTATGGRRGGERRSGQRRMFARLTHPPTAAPKVLNANFRIANMSQIGMNLVCRNTCEECTDPVNLKSILALKIQFHDEEVVDVKVAIIRCERDPKSGEKTYSGLIENGISAERIAKEQAYLLSHYPDHCRAIYHDQKSQNQHRLVSDDNVKD
jgi:hypothetical protein